ncbi:MAG: leucine--tRNA ligase [Candidatus Thiodiazotropha lotti]|uniref:Leucine--tRNA ligase n=1 Tax=Candidatus Thiodiazotropha endoloripes TaxID=1818881 RepID=A0A1E2UNN6_9GAMM|nr:leucine--tRNA ligase [Candidatus Thiodiazotropha endoloripes]MCG7899229.1 leucine--tRNA ligase [Candidatus Thiodiazotropha weberae]MCG7986741.1 leucine--tRNA ligase [Candidatus Thiodiazotropha lotti]MCG7902836.1 leucine--tRNA ligase [Candidatus Thiodiazotropha weberae]MCG7912517.1 leucine--tRNA ligase [Candidatus Thiodiazotropha weberae]MCG7991330.1 leucine--tRNA ligase [Candidatus Thiodiazotropha lotti]
MQNQYDPAQLEAEVQSYWENAKIFQVTEDPQKEKFYCLSMFPYPSGKLHMGHVRNYTIGDVIARYQRMLGKNVLQPMGWDAFGLPAENAALKNRVAPAAWTYQNIDYMKAQLKRLGFGYDWQRELATCQPEYYKWEQWLFTELYKKGLVYRKNAQVNWDPVDQTVLANEQVIDGRGWRSGALVERREIPQWFIKITDYADELLDEIDGLEAWPEQVRTMQRNWIGRSYGVQMDFAIEGAEQGLTIYTTRPDTLMGVTYVAVAAEHPLALEASADKPELAGFIEECRQGGTSEAELETIEKRGMPLGIDAIHPVSGEPVPVYAANFVLMTYGTGAVMAVPGHDERDHAFAKKYGIPIKQVIQPEDGSVLDIQAEAYIEKGVLIDSGPFTGQTSAEAFDAIAEWLQAREKGGKTKNYRLRDWGVSRQRYWGTPIPMIHCDHCGIVPVPLDDLPVRLPEEIVYDENTINPIKNNPQFSDVTCPECGGAAQRETDTFDTFMESSWYYARYACPGADSMLDQRADYWLPVDQYVGGIEHAVLHLLYARFYHKLMRDAGLLSSNEPFTRLLTQGMVVADTYYREAEDGSKHWYNPTEVDVSSDDKGRPLSALLKADNSAVQIGGIEKMSKSKNNGVDPQTLIDRYGADTVRLYTMFTSPPDQSLEWSDDGVEGAYRFIKRLWALADGHQQQLSQPLAEVTDFDEAQKAARRELHELLKKALYDYKRQRFNNVVSASMGMTNILYKLDGSDQDLTIMKEGLSLVLRLLAPIAPHVSHHLWRQLGFGDEILASDWPQPDEAALVQESLPYVVQVNGKVRANIQVPADADRAAVEAIALANDNVQRFIGEATVRKVIVVPNKLVNVVAK